MDLHSTAFGSFMAGRGLHASGGVSKIAPLVRLAREMATSTSLVRGLVLRMSVTSVGFELRHCNIHNNVLSEQQLRRVLHVLRGDIT